MNKFRLKRGLYNKKKKVFPFYDRPLTYKTNRSINQLKNAHKEWEEWLSAHIFIVKKSEMFEWCDWKKCKQNYFLDN